MNNVVLIFILASTVLRTWKTDASSFTFPSPVVRTKNGAVRGRVVRAANGCYAQEFLNIPYAQPPINALRFRAPQPVENWTGEHDGTRLGNACVQSNAELGELFKNAPYILDADLTTINEDCLTVNVYVPYPSKAAEKLASKSKSDLLPVMIWIHGGGFQWGSNNFAVYNASILASEINAVVATINYRLGALGFFTLENVDGVGGNQGLLDQALAIKWVRDNARHFGGNPEQITLFGQSAGAASVQYHTFSSTSRDLFARSIMQSGSAASFWAYHTREQARNASRNFAITAGCDETDDDQDLFECFKSKSVDEILTADIKVQRTTKMPLKPTIDGVFFTKSPADYLHDRDFKRAPVLIGGTTNESLWSLGVYWPNEILHELPHVRLTEKQFNSMLLQMTGSFSNTTRDAVKFIYRDWTVFSDEDSMAGERWRILKTVSDDLFTNVGMFETIDAYAAADVPIYRYRFDQLSKIIMFGYNFYGVVHCDDVPFFFGHPLDSALKYSKDEVEFTRKLLQTLGRFARTGDPGFNSSVQSIILLNSGNYGVLKSTSSEERQRFEFWNRAVPYLTKLEARIGPG